MTLTNLRRCLHLQFLFGNANMYRYAIRSPHYFIFYLLDLLFILYPFSVAEQILYVCRALEIEHTFHIRIYCYLRSNT